MTSDKEDPRIAAKVRVVMEEIRSHSPGARLADVPTLFAFGPIYRAIEEAEARVRELELRLGCECACCDHGEGSDCGCDCHASGRCAHVMQSNGPGTLMVGTKDGQVVVELPRDMTGHIVFSVQQAHDFAHVMVRQAILAARPPGSL